MPYQRFDLRHVSGDTTDPDVLHRLIADDELDRVIVLAGRNRQESSRGSKEEFIVGDRLVSLLMSQVAENDDLTDVLATLLSPDGPEIASISARSIVPAGHTTRIGSIAEHVAGHGCYLLGHKAKGRVELNLPLAMMITPVEHDEFIVVR